MRQRDGRQEIRDGLALLGIHRLGLMIHNTCFPSLAEEDLGCGSPFSHGGRAFVRFVYELGFDTLIMGPQGQTLATDRSPYRASGSSRCLLSLAPRPLCAARLGLISPAHLQRLVQGAPVTQGGAARDRVDFPYAHNSAQGLLEGAHAALRQMDESKAELRAQFRKYIDDQLVPGGWLQQDAVFFALAETNATEQWQHWPTSERALFTPNAMEAPLRARRLQGLLSTMPGLTERFLFGQFLMQGQHDELRAEASAMGMSLFVESTGAAAPENDLRNFDALVSVDPAHPRPQGWAVTSSYFDPPVWTHHDADPQRRVAHCLAALSKPFMTSAPNVAVCFSDLFGLTQSYAGPDAAAEMQFTLRVPSDYARAYPSDRASGRAFDLRGAVALALRAQVPSPAALSLAGALELPSSS